jgi:hypothetical protein
MGVCLVVYAISDNTITSILEEPALVWRVVDRDDDSRYLEEIRRRSKPSLWARLFGKAPPPQAPDTLILADCENQFADLDKSWDGLNACLRCCCPDTLNFFEDGKPLSQIEIGYGPGLYHDANAMAGIAKAYLAVDDARLLAAFDTVDFSNCYLQKLWENPDNAAKEYLLENFAEFKLLLAHIQRYKLGAMLQFT